MEGSWCKFVKNQDCCGILDYKWWRDVIDFLSQKWVSHHGRPPRIITCSSFCPKSVNWSRCVLVYYDKLCDSGHSQTKALDGPGGAITGQHILFHVWTFHTGLYSRLEAAIFLVQVVLTSSILIVVTEVWVDGPAELQNIIPLVFIQSLVLGLLRETLMGGSQWGNNTERGVKSCLKMNWFHVSFIRAMRFTSRNWLKTGKSGHDLPSSRASINFAVSMSKLLWFLSWGQKQLSEWAQ